MISVLDIVNSHVVLKKKISHINNNFFCILLPLIFLFTTNYIFGFTFLNDFSLITCKLRVTFVEGISQRITAIGYRTMIRIRLDVHFV